MKLFADILALRGRILLFTPNVFEAVPLEEMATRAFFNVVVTRGMSDPMVPLTAWSRIHGAREHGVFSTDQHRFLQGVRIPCTDIVWVGNSGSTEHEPALYARYCQAMSRGALHQGDDPPRLWLLAATAVQPT